MAAGKPKRPHKRSKTELGSPSLPQLKAMAATGDAEIWRQMGEGAHAEAMAVTSEAEIWHKMHAGAHAAVRGQLPQGVPSHSSTLPVIGKVPEPSRFELQPEPEPEPQGPLHPPGGGGFAATYGCLGVTQTWPRGAIRRDSQSEVPTACLSSNPLILGLF